MEEQNNQKSQCIFEGCAFQNRSGIHVIYRGFKFRLIYPQIISDN